MASKITVASNWIICSGANQRKHQSSAPLAFLDGNSQRKGPMKRKMLPGNVVIIFLVAGRVGINQNEVYDKDMHHTRTHLWGVNIHPSLDTCRRDQMSAIFQLTFQMHFLERKCMNFVYLFSLLELAQGNSDKLQIYNHQLRGQCVNAPMENAIAVLDRWLLYWIMKNREKPTEKT